MVNKALLVEFITAQKRSKPFKALGSEHMNKPCPIIPSNLTSSALQSLEFQMDAFCLREQDLLNRFAMEVSQRQKQEESKEYSVLLFQSYQPAEDLGRASSDRSILQTFIDVEATVPVGSLKLRLTVTDLVKICLCTYLYG